MESLSSSIIVTWVVSRDYVLAIFKDHFSSNVDVEY